MSFLQSAIRKLPGRLQTAVVRKLYRRKGLHMKSMRSYSGGKYYIYEVNGTFVPATSLSWFISYEHYKDQVDRISAWAYRPGPGDIVVDIGSGVGEELLVYGKMMNNTGTIYAIEANIQTFEVVKDVAKLNNITNVKAFNQAINTEDAQVVLSVSDDNFLEGSIAEGISQGNNFTVDGVRMDTFAKQNNIDRIDFLKANIEGAERFVISSMGDLISKVRNIAIACHDFRFRAEGNEFFKTKDMVVDFLTRNNFKVTQQSTGVDFIDDWVYGKNMSF